MAFAFLIGTTIGLFILVMRRWIPESPRWLMTHGFVEEAGAVVRGIEAHFPGEVCANTPERPRVRLRMRAHTPLTEVARALFKMLSAAHTGRPFADDRASLFLQCRSSSPTR